DPERQAQELLNFATSVASSPVLFYQGDPDLLMVSRHRDALGRSFRFIVPGAELVEDLVDKARFLLLARRLELPVPSSCHLRPAREETPTGLKMPLVVKPLVRRSDVWGGVIGEAKATRVQTQAEL